MALRKIPMRFKALGRMPCPACRDRSALSAADRPLWDRGQKLTWGCEVCEGDGEITAAEKLGDWPPHDVWRVKRDGGER